MKSKTIGIILAMDKELNLLLPMIENITESNSDGYDFYSGEINGNKIVAMKCGIGKVNAALGAYVLIKKFAPDLVINTGVAGGASEQVNVMDVIICESIAYHDVWCGPGTVWGEAAGCPLYFKSTADYVDACMAMSVLNVKKGLICSGDRFVASKEDILYIKSKFPEALAVDMESAAIAQMCHKQNVDYLCIRIISDSPCVSHDNAMQYEDFWVDAPAHVFEVVDKLLRTI